MADEVDIRPEARADLDGIFDYTAERWSFEQAIDYSARFNEAFERLADGTALIRSRPDAPEGIRVVAVGSHHVFLRKDDDMITVLRVLHQSVDPRRHL